MALTKSLALIWAGSYWTVAVLVARLTFARLTPGALDSVRSMVRAQAAQVMPDTGRSTRSSGTGRATWCSEMSTVFMPALRSQAAGRRRRADPVGRGPYHTPRWRGHL